MTITNSNPANTNLQRPQRARATNEDLNNWLCDEAKKGAMRAPFKTCHLIPQSAYVFDESDNAMIPTDRILKFENLTADLTRLCAQRGLPDMELACTNASEMPIFDSSALTEEVRNAVRFAHARDFKLLSYPLRTESSQRLSQSFI